MLFDFSLVKVSTRRRVKTVVKTFKTLWKVEENTEYNPYLLQKGGSSSTGDIKFYSTGPWHWRFYH